MSQRFSVLSVLLLTIIRWLLIDYEIVVVLLTILRACLEIKIVARFVAADNSQKLIATLFLLCYGFSAASWLVPLSVSNSLVMGTAIAFNLALSASPIWLLRYFKVVSLTAVAAAVALSAVLYEAISKAWTFGVPVGLNSEFAMASSVFADVAAVIGATGVICIVYIIGGLFSIYISRVRELVLSKNWLPAAGIVAIVLVCKALGSIVASRLEPEVESTMKVHSVSTNVDCEGKDTRLNVAYTTNLVKTCILKLSSKDTSMIVFPENSILAPLSTAAYNVGENTISSFGMNITEFLDSLNSPMTVVIGVVVYTLPSQYDTKNERANYNISDDGRLYLLHSVALTIDREAHTISAAKQRYVPYEETLPDVFPIINLVIESLRTNSGAVDARWVPLRDQYISKTGDYQTTICFESLALGGVLASRVTGRYVISILNECWYDETILAKLFAFAAKAASYTTGSPIVRSSNGGVTEIVVPSVYSASAQITQRTGQGLDIVSGDVPLRSPNMYMIRVSVEVVAIVAVIIILVRRMLRQIQAT